jgi:hypothetical protein
MVRPGDSKTVAEEWEEEKADATCEMVELCHAWPRRVGFTLAKL